MFLALLAHRCMLTLLPATLRKRPHTPSTPTPTHPQAPGRCRLITRICTRFTKSQLPARLMRALPVWAQHVFSHVPLEDDQVTLGRAVGQAVAQPGGMAMRACGPDRSFELGPASL
jgi:hypothetical protein